MPPRSITVVIADRDRRRSNACLRVLRPEKDIRVLGQARSGLEALAATSLKPQVLLLDLSLSCGSGSELLPALRRSNPGMRIILVAGSASKPRILAALSRGANGYLEMKHLRAFLAKAVRLVGAGQAWISRGLMAEVVNRLARQAA
jgi:DNA-binding NarL/FixJ family response regulator